MRELSQKEYKIQNALGTLKKYRITIEVCDGNKTKLITIPIKAVNLVDALHKAWKKKRR